MAKQSSASFRLNLRFDFPTVEQWLSTGNSKEYITFPIAFTAADTATLLVTPYHRDGATHPTEGWSVSMTSASTAHCSLTGYDLRVIAVGW